MNKIFGSFILVAILGIIACNPASTGANSDSAKIQTMVQTKIDSLTKELAADCDRRIASTVKAKAAAAAAARRTVAPSTNTGSGTGGSASTSSTLPTTVKPATKTGKLGGNLGNKGKVISGTGERVKQTVNKTFDPAKKKKGKLSGKK